MCNYIFAKYLEWTSLLSDLVRRDEGASALEYALMAAMVAMVLVPFVPTIGQAVTAIFTAIQTALTQAAGG